MHDASVTTRGLVLENGTAMTVDIMISWDRENHGKVELIFFGSCAPATWRLPVTLFLTAVYTRGMAKCDDATLQMLGARTAEVFKVKTDVKDFRGDPMLLHIEGTERESGQRRSYCANVLVDHDVLWAFCDQIGDSIEKMAKALP